MPTGSYRIRFQGGCNNAGSYAPQFYRGQTNQATANPVELTAGKTRGGINAAMRPGATIAGLITDTAGNRPRDACVVITPVSDLRFGFYFSNLAFAFNGAYQATNLTPGLYAVNFGCFYGVGTLARQWFMDKPDPGSANFVSATAGSVTSGVNAVLQPSGSIAGTVTNRNGQPLARICVTATPVGEASLTRFFFGSNTAVTQKDGSYVLREMPPATYVVQFFECGRGLFGSRWYKQKATPQSGTPVTVAPGGAVTGIDETLAPGGSISGRVRNDSGTPAARTCVEAVDAATESARLRRDQRQRELHHRRPEHRLLPDDVHTVPESHAAARDVGPAGAGGGQGARRRHGHQREARGGRIDRRRSARQRRQAGWRLRGSGACRSWQLGGRSHDRPAW